MIKKEGEPAVVGVVGGSKLAVHQLAYFWERYFSMVSSVIITDLGTCYGAFPLHKREIAFRVGDKDYFLRFNVFRTAAQVMEQIKRLHPTSLQFGGVLPGHHLEKQPVYPPRLDDSGKNHYTARPRDFDRSLINNNLASPLGHVLIDVDLDCAASATAGEIPPYDRTRVCHCGVARRICDKCWEVFMEPARAIIEHILRNVYGFQAVFTVFSGRRGFHTWILDRRVIYWTNAQRASFVESIRWPIAGSELEESAYELLAPLFDDHPALASRFTPPLDSRHHAEAHKQAVFCALYPKVDVAVTRNATHLHKLPLTLHPENGNLCFVMRSGKKMVPSRDVVSYCNITEQHMMDGLAIISEAICAAKNEGE